MLPYYASVVQAHAWTFNGEYKKVTLKWINWRSYIWIGKISYDQQSTRRSAVPGTHAEKRLSATESLSRNGVAVKPQTLKLRLSCPLEALVFLNRCDRVFACYGQRNVGLKDCALDRSPWECISITMTLIWQITFTKRSPRRRCKFTFFSRRCCGSAFSASYSACSHQSWPARFSVSR